jgi:L-2-hydroxycarboxylate dehydrogenase (NAD+)
MKMHTTNITRIMPDPLRGFVKSAFLANGMTDADAILLADMMVATDLRGFCRHGTYLTASYVKKISQGKVNPRPRVDIVNESPTTAVVDGDGGMGHLAAYKAAQLAVNKAKEMGLGAATSRNHFHFGAASNYTRLALAEDCVGLATSARRFDMDPEDGIFCAFGSSPLSIAIPAGDQPPMVLDMGCYLDAGERWKEAFEILPRGYFKMMGMGAVCMGLGGSLPGICDFDQALNPDAWDCGNQGAFIMAIDINRFRSLADFKSDMDDYVSEVRDLPPAPGHDRADLPGGLEQDREREWAEVGIPIYHNHLKVLKKLADQYELTMPY